MAKVTVSAGDCGYTAVITAEKTGKKKVRLRIVCPCEMVKDLAEDLEGEYGREVFSPILDSEIYRVSSRHIKHTACPVPSAILKAVEVELDLALPKDVRMKIKK
ncbi:MAG: hypothetical protein GXO65_05605 [Euryarchaeota archaeon]|nr:hypothetical protein [Euryarchaeota archaeon]